VSSSRGELRLVVIAEDRRTERFARRLLSTLGFDSRRMRFETAPPGEGAGEQFVRRQYAEEVRILRSKSFQKLGVVAIRDGDRLGVGRRKRELDLALADAGLDPRGAEERIATPVPTWSIETWLLFLNGHVPDESRSFVGDFEAAFRTGDDEEEAIRRAARSWGPVAPGEPPSLADGRAELGRLDP
jgi:hypothetical protein